MRKKNKKFLEWLEEQKFTEINNNDKFEFFRTYCKQVKSRSILLIAFILSIFLIIGTMAINPEYSITIVICLILLEITFCFVTIREDTTIINKLRKNNVKVLSKEVSVPIEIIDAICYNVKKNPSKFITKFDDNTEFSDYSQDYDSQKVNKFRNSFLLIKKDKIFGKFIDFCVDYDASDNVVFDIYYIRNKRTINIISVEERKDN